MSDTASNAAALPKDTKTSAKKRKTKAPANRPPSSDASGSQAQDHGVNGTRDSPGESQYFKELNRFDYISTLYGFSCLMKKQEYSQHPQEASGLCKDR